MAIRLLVRACGAPRTVFLICASLVGCQGGQPTKTNPDGSGMTPGPVSTLPSDALLVPWSESETGALDPMCRRDVSLTAVAVTEPEPFDLIIVADHSKSLAWSRDELSNGLRNLLSSVQGQSVRVFLLTPTQYGASSALAQPPGFTTSVVPYRDETTGQPFTHEMTTFDRSCTGPAGAPIPCPSSTDMTPYKMVGTWKFNMPTPIAQIRSDMTDAQFAAQQKAVADAIVSMGGTGSPKEQPLCTLSRYVSQPQASLPKNAVFLIISDEDDVSKPLDCLIGFNADVSTTMKESPCTSNCDVYRYRAIADAEEELFVSTCAAFDDVGNQVAGTDRPLNLSSPGSCAGVPPGPCTTADRAHVNPFCYPGLSLVNCNRTCPIRTTFCTIDLGLDAVTNPCTQPFTQKNVRYTTFLDYCVATEPRGSNWRGCAGGGLYLRPEVTGTGYLPRLLMYGSTTADVGKYFTSTSKTAFANGRYLVEAIVFDPSFSCPPLGEGQSYAKSIIDVVNDRSRVFPLCGSYAPALAGVSNFAQTLIQTTYSVTLQSDEHVTSVKVRGKDGVTRTLTTAQFTYKVDTRTLVIERSALRANDANLQVEVTSDCRPYVP